MAGPHNFVSVSRRPPDVEDYIDILRRYRSWVIGPTFAGLVISVVVAFWWPDMYECTASMQIKPGAVPTSLMPSAEVGRMAQRLQQLQREILGRDNLISMIQNPKLDLYKKERARLPTEDVAEEYFRKHVHINTYTAEADGRGGQAFKIFFDYPDRNKARDVVQALVTQFTDKDMALQFNTATSASGFLDEVVKNAREKMDKAQLAITAFSTEYQGRLPENFQANMIEVQNRATTLANINEAISTEKQHQALLESALNNNKNMQSQAEANLTQTQTTSNNVVKNQNLINLEQMIAAGNVKLQTDLAKYQPGFPDVLADKDAIHALEERRDNILKEEAAGGSGRGSTTVQVRNPQAEQQLTTLKAEENNIRAQIQASVLAIDNKTRQGAEITRQLKEANDKVAASPAIVQQFNRLTEDLVMARTDYQNLSGKKDQSDQTAKMQERRAGETLEVLEQPITPETPTSPVRGVIVGIGTMVGLVLGFALAGAKEIKDTSLKNLKDVRAYTNLPVLSSIPLLENALLVRRKRRLAWLAWSSAIIVGGILMTGAMYYHFVVAAQQVS